MSTVRPGRKSALVVVDVQIGVMATCWDAARVVANVARAVRRARAQGAVVLWVQHHGDDLPHGSAAWQWVPELGPAPGECRIDKRYPSSFEDTGLEAEFARLGVSHLVLAGAQTNWCIRATAYAALDRGDDLTLLEDAHTTADLDPGRGTPIRAADIVAELNVAMQWLAYPGRRCGLARAAAVDFPAADDGG